MSRILSKDRLTTKAINMISTFRAKALRLELVEGDEDNHVHFYTSEYIKKHVKKYKPIKWI